ncbi:MAG TPA: hypothetical protein VNA69_06000 [Thermoanaerobaculia bacterium]|nr:hypothetical protein [Thermoanaerobaculia bacterium]
MTQDSNIAWLSAATHTVASAAVLFLMRPALPPFTNEERIAMSVGALQHNVLVEIVSTAILFFSSSGW